MRIAVIGPLEVAGDDEAPVTVPGAKERLLLAVLAAGAPAVVGVDRIVDAVWDGAPPPTARKSLQAHVVRLRTALEPHRPRGSTGRYVVRRGPGYALAVDRSELDALAIGDLVARGRARLAAGDAPASERVLADALALWRGEPYADWPEAEFAVPERRRLAEVRASAVAGLVEARLAQGRAADVVPDLERLVTEEPLREDWWRLLVLALYRTGRQADALGAGRRARAVLADELGADPGPALRAMETAVLAQDPALDLTEAVVPGPAEPAPDHVAAGTCPYKGLSAYQQEDAPLFHGRGRLVAGLVARLVDAPLLALSGPSGAGKSSVVRAGLLPALAAGALPGSEAWRPLVLLPGRRPVDGLADLTGDSPPSRPVVLVCDQFEELWAPGVDAAERSAFLDTVLSLLDDGVLARCVVVLRGDHVGRLSEHPAFVERLGTALVLTPALTDPELRAIVREPAGAVGLTVDDDLLDAVVADVLGRPGALPLLSTALVGTWERRRGSRLTLSGYLAAGGVAGALTRSAETAYGGLDETGQDHARRLFVRLADVDDAGALVRRAVPLAEVALTGERGRARREVVETFVGRRLLAVDGDRLEVAHEALLTSWPRLARWLEEDAAGRAVRRHLAPAARDWDAGGRQDDELYRGARLAAALDWCARDDADPSPVEREFLETSRAHADAELAAAHLRADREASARRRTRLLARALAAMLAAVLVVVVIAVRSERDAESRQAEATMAARVADANRLATFSTRAGPLDLSLLLAAQAVRLAETPETHDRLLSALVDHRRVERVVPLSAPPVDALLAGDGSLFLAGTHDWSVWPGGEPGPHRPPQAPGDWWGFVAADASPAEGLMVVTGGNGEAPPWVRLMTSAGGASLLLEGLSVGGFPFAVSFTADGRRIRVLAHAAVEDTSPAGTGWHVVETDLTGAAPVVLAAAGTVPPATGPPLGDFADGGNSLVVWAGAADGTGAGDGAVLVDLAPARQVPLQVPHRAATAVGFRALPSGAAQLWSDGSVTLYDRDGAVVQQVDAHRATVTDVEVSPDGTWAVTTGGEPGVLLWNVAPGTGQWTQREALPGHADVVSEAEIAPDGERLFTVARDDTAIVWDVRADGGFGDPYPDLPGRWVAGRPEVVEPGRLVVVPTRPVSRTDAGNRTDPPADTLSVSATFFDPGTGRVVEDVAIADLPAELGVYAAVGVGTSVAVSPDRTRVAVTTGLETTVLDTGTRDEVARIRPSAEREADDDGRSAPSAVVSCAEWTPDGSRLLLCVQAASFQGGTGDLAVVDVETAEIERRVPSGGGAQASAVSPDGRLLALGSSYRPKVTLLDAETLDPLHVVQLGATDVIEDLSFSPDGGMLAVAGRGGLLQLVDTVHGEPVGEPVAFGTRLLQADWLSDGRTVAVAALDGTVSLFDSDRGLLRTSSPLPASGVVADSTVHLVPGAGEELIAFSGELPGRRYRLEPSAWLADACAIVGRDLTRTEWERHLPTRPYEPTCSDLG